jgi:hypothetical protein
LVFFFGLLDGAIKTYDLKAESKESYVITSDSFSRSLSETLSSEGALSEPALLPSELGEASPEIDAAFLDLLF